MSRVYYQRHPERTVLYRVLFHYFELFLLEYENRFEKHFKETTRKELTPGIIAVIQSFGKKINFHPHLHFLVTEGGRDKQDRFHKVSSINDSLLCWFFTREVFSLLLHKHQRKVKL